MSSFFWSRWIRSLSARPGRNPRRTARLTLESLECRITPVTRTWDGGGAMNNWSDKLNWSGDVAPVAGDNLFFPDALPAIETRTLTNDLPAGTAFGNITFANLSATNAYTLTGNSITLGGATDANTLIANASAIGNDIQLDVLTTGSGKQTIQVNNNAS